MRLSVGWRAEQWLGLEHLVLSASRGGWRASGTVVTADDALTSVRYEFQCDASWRFAALSVTASTAGGERQLTLTAGAGCGWMSDGRARPDLSDCVDIDLSCTPATNTLPVRRLHWVPGQSADLRVAYVRMPDLTVHATAQRYTLLAAAHGSRPAVFRYESASFRADLEVDDNGLVLDYPGVWHRIAGQPTVTD